ncbi:hypothetical protein EDC04DRAFT_2724652 [Pisolithus marmoratus]|nr:hypothetical protein EDC04DRAFT_2724652 [Pisolithus marmoratus]
MSAVPSVHNLVNDESSTPLRVVKPYTDVSPPFICRWTGPGSNQCSQLIDFSNVAEHLAEAHGIKNTPWDVLLHCGWQDCGKKVIRKNLLRHTREVHLRPSRRSNRAVTNWRERRREAHGDFLEIGREMSELGIVWKGEAKEHKDADPYSDLVHVESSESESVAKRDKVGTSPDEADQQNDAFDSSNDEPLRDVFPGDAFWETGVSDRCPPVKPQKAGLLSKLSTLLWRPKSRQCAQERVRASPEIISTARPTVRLSVLPWKEDRRDRLRSRADRVGCSQTPLPLLVLQYIHSTALKRPRPTRASTRVSIATDSQQDTKVTWTHHCIGTAPQRLLLTLEMDRRVMANMTEGVLRAVPSRPNLPIRVTDRHNPP